MLIPVATTDASAFFPMDRKSPESGFLIGDIARRSGVQIETIRYYERAGVVPKPGRTPGGHRLYSSEQLNRLVFIRRSRELGFSLAEVRALLDLVDGGEMTCEEIHGITMEHLTNVRQKLTDLHRLERALKELAGQCSKGKVPDCPIVDTLFAAV